MIEKWALWGGLALIAASLIISTLGVIYDLTFWLYWPTMIMCFAGIFGASFGASVFMDRHVRRQDH